MNNLSNYLFIYSFTYLSNLSLFLNTIDLLDYLPIYLNIYFSYLFCLFISTFLSTLDISYFLFIFIHFLSYLTSTVIKFISTINVCQISGDSLFKTKKSHFPKPVTAALPSA